MLLETVTRLMRAYSNCPKCGAVMMRDDFESNGNKASLECKCGWNLEVIERTKQNEVKIWKQD